jgi:hypothetical protein
MASQTRHSSRARVLICVAVFLIRNTRLVTASLWLLFLLVFDAASFVILSLFESRSAAAVGSVLFSDLLELVSVQRFGIVPLHHDCSMDSSSVRGFSIRLHGRPLALRRVFGIPVSN